MLGALPPEVLVLLDTAHIWGPPVTLVCVLLFGPLAGANRLLSRNAQAVGGVGGGPLGSLGRFTHRAWFAFSTACHPAGGAVVRRAHARRRALLSLGLEVIPARTGAPRRARRRREASPDEALWTIRAGGRARARGGVPGEPSRLALALL